MKRILKLKQHLLVPALLILGLASCKKDNNGGVDGTVGGKGAPVINSVRTLNKTTNDTTSATYTTYNSSGTASTSTSTVIQQQITAQDSTTTTGKLGNYYVIEGQNLGSATAIYINGVSVYFNRALNSDNTLIFNIPMTTPYVQPQPNTLKVVTLYGSVTYSFTTLPPAPTVSTVSDYYFTANSQLTLKGQGFAAVTGVTLKGTTAAASIVSKNDSVLVIKMPATTVSSASLLFAYTSGSKSLQAGTTQVFIDLDNNAGGIIFANGVWGTATTGGNSGQWGDNSWQGPSGYSATAPSVSGKGALVLTYPSNGWKVEGFANWWPGFSYDPSYSYLSFWIKGGKAEHKLLIVGDQMPGGYGNSVDPAANTTPAARVVDVMPNTWQYFKIPLSKDRSTTNGNLLNVWQNGTVTNQFGFFLKGSSSDPDETMYVDQIVFVK